MVSIGKIGGAPNAERYYTDTVARGQEDYYAGQGEAEDDWTGAGATQLGLAGGVDADVFSTLLRGTAPSGDKPATGRGRSFLVERGLTSNAELEALVADYVSESERRDEPAAIVREPAALLSPRTPWTAVPVARGSRLNRTKPAENHERPASDETGRV